MRFALVVVVVLGCASDPDDGLDVTFGGRPVLVAARIDDGPWAVQAPLSFQVTSTIYHLPHGQAYDVISVCKFEDGYLQAVETRTTEAERRSLASNDCREPPVSELAVHVHTTKGPLQLGWTGGSDLGILVDEDFVFDVPAETIDFVAANPDHVAIVRNIDATGDVTLDPIDLDAAPATMTTPIAFDLLGSDLTAFSTVSFATHGGASTFWSTPPGQPHLLPELETGDFETLSLGGDGPAGTGGRVYSASVEEGLPSTVVPPWIPLLGEVQFDPAIAFTWTPFDSPYATQTLQCIGRTYGLFITETKAWARAHDEATLAFDHAIAGWDPNWTFQVRSHDCMFEVVDRLTSTETMAAYSAWFP